MGKAEMVKHSRSGKPSSLTTDAKRSERHPLFGALKGVTSVPPGVDLTEPADPDWGNVYEENDVVAAKRGASRDP
jgi:hypothetical protein